MTKSISLYAGKNARKIIREQGLEQSLFRVMAGASGGPKWFTLFGLDKYLFGEFFNNRKTPLYTLGSSVGSWRMACFAQKNPVSAIERLALYYSRETYSKKPDAYEISQKAEVMLHKVLGDNGALEIIDNPIIQTHFIVAKAKGLNASEIRPLQLLGLITAASANSVSRKTLNHFFERFIFHTQNQTFSSSHFKFDDLPTQYTKVDQTNLHQTLMASGSIPLVLRGVKDINNAPNGIYRDGGIIDYHLDLPLAQASEGLVLYPHFFPVIKPGWFDKNLKSRHANADNFDNTLVITPSLSHIEKLPFGKISDRNDFQNLDDDSRFKYWQTILTESHRVADDFQAIVEGKNAADYIQDIELIL